MFYISIRIPAKNNQKNEFSSKVSLAAINIKISDTPIHFHAASHSQDRIPPRRAAIKAVFHPSAREALARINIPSFPIRRSTDLITELLALPGRACELVHFSRRAANRARPARGKKRERSLGIISTGKMDFEQGGIYRARRARKKKPSLRRE